MGRLGTIPLDLIRVLAEGTIAFLAEESREPLPWEFLRPFIVLFGIFFIGGHELFPQFLHLFLSCLSLVCRALEVHIVFRLCCSLKRFQLRWLLFIIDLVLYRVTVEVGTIHIYASAFFSNEGFVFFRKGSIYSLQGRICFINFDGEGDAQEAGYS